MHRSILPLWCLYHMQPGVWRRLDLLELELGLVVSHCVGPLEQPALLLAKHSFQPVFVLYFIWVMSTCLYGAVCMSTGAH